MNALHHHTVASKGPPLAPRGTLAAGRGAAVNLGHTAAPYVRIVMDDGLAHEIGAPRQALCSCGEVRSSSEPQRLFGFTDKSLNSDWSQKHCRHCGKLEVAHHPGCSAVSPDQYERHQFEPRDEAAEFDSFYCGCRGWD